jgi:glutathione S-transferase
MADSAQGPYFLGKTMCLVDVQLAPFALRLSRLAPFRDFPSPTPASRWRQWLDALEQDPHVRATMSADALYAQSMDDLLKGYQGMLD